MPGVAEAEAEDEAETKALQGGSNCNRVVKIKMLLKNCYWVSSVPSLCFESITFKFMPTPTPNKSNLRNQKKPCTDEPFNDPQIYIL